MKHHSPFHITKLTQKSSLSAVNQQKFHIDFIGPSAAAENKDGSAAKAKVSIRPGASLMGYTGIDMGIAKCHFEIGAGADNFEWESFPGDGNEKRR